MPIHNSELVLFYIMHRKPLFAVPNAIHFEQNSIVKNDSVFFKIPLKSVAPGMYEYVGVSLAYQNYEVKFLLDTSINVGGTNYPIKQEFPCNVASFVGFNTYIKNYTMHNQSVTVNGNRLQGIGR